MQKMKYYNNAQQIKEPQNQSYSLWISGQRFAHNLDELAKHKIEAVCSLGSDTFNFPKQISNMYLQVEDTQTEDITEVLYKAYEFIQTQRKTSNVLVHCIAGISRSATVLTYYLMRKYGWSFAQSLRCVAQCRPIVRPNHGFVKQLIKQGQKLFAQKITSKI